MINIRMEDIPYDLHAMVEVVGMEKFEEISKLYGGTAIYIPVYKRIIIGGRNREILRTYNGKNINELRLKYGISNQQIRRIIENNSTFN